MAFYPCTNNQIDKLLDGSITKIRSLVPKLTSFALAFCLDLTEVDLPNISTIGNSTFQGDTSLRELIFNQTINIISANAFNASGLDTLVLKGDAVTTLASLNAFNATPFSSDGTGGKLYVPQALISTYQSANNWSTILGYPNNQILAIEGSPYEN
jgi:hypothetical protein